MKCLLNDCVYIILYQYFHLHDTSSNLFSRHLNIVSVFECHGKFCKFKSYKYLKKQALNTYVMTITINMNVIGQYIVSRLA